MKQVPEFLSSVKGGKEIADAELAASLFKRATGYNYANEKLFLTREGDVVREPIIVPVPSDPGAAMNWLKNRQPDIWRDKQQNNLTGEIEVTMDLGNSNLNNKDDD